MRVSLGGGFVKAVSCTMLMTGETAKQNHRVFHFSLIYTRRCTRTIECTQTQTQTHHTAWNATLTDFFSSHTHISTQPSRSRSPSSTAALSIGWRISRRSATGSCCSCLSRCRPHWSVNRWGWWLEPRAPYRCAITSPPTVVAATTTERSCYLFGWLWGRTKGRCFIRSGVRSHKVSAGRQNYHAGTK